MSHTRDHIIITSLRNTVAFGTDNSVPPKPPGKLRVWHIIAAVLLIGIIIGAQF